MSIRGRNAVLDKLIIIGNRRNAPYDMSAIAYCACLLAIIVAVISGFVEIAGFASEGGYIEEFGGFFGGDSPYESSFAPYYAAFAFCTSPGYIVAGMILLVVFIRVLYEYYRFSNIIPKIVITLVMVAIVAAVGAYIHLFDLENLSLSDPENPEVLQLAAFLSSIGMSYQGLVSVLVWCIIGLVIAFMLLLVFAREEWLARKFVITLLVVYAAIPASVLLLQDAASVILIVLFGIPLIMIIMGLRDIATGKYVPSSVSSRSYSAPRCSYEDVYESTEETEQESKPEKKGPEIPSKKISKNTKVFRGESTMSGKAIFFVNQFDDVNRICSQSEYDKGKFRIIESETGKDHVVLPSPPSNAKALMGWD